MKPTKPQGETKDEAFIRIAQERTKDILKKIDTLGNLSNRRLYRYSEEDVDKIFEAIEKKAKAVNAKFYYSNNEEEFKL